MATVGRKTNSIIIGVVVLLGLDAITAPETVVRPVEEPMPLRSPVEEIRVKCIPPTVDWPINSMKASSRRFGEKQEILVQYQVCYEA